MTFEEWNQFAPHLGDAALAPGFAIGDWLIYGERFAPKRALPGFENMPAEVPHVCFTSTGQTVVLAV